MTSIEWVNGYEGRKAETWNPVTGCSKVSPGCKNCYAIPIARRLSKGGHAAYFGMTTQKGKGTPNWSGQVRLIPERIKQPLSWVKPRMCFVNSMSDLFHEDLPDADIDKILRVIDMADRHLFLVLTKRPERMQAVISKWISNSFGYRHIPNLWLGVSVEDQQRADERIHHLLQTPAAVRFLSLEPMLEPIDLSHPLWKRIHPRIHWIIVGGESGPGKRPFDPDWARSIRDQCHNAGVPFFMKQMNVNGRVSKDPTEWPEDLRIRQYPKTKENRSIHVSQ
jgi:protein gp37